MPIAEFEEKEYEGAANVELQVGGRVFPVGQMIEGLLGVDSLAAPHVDHTIWQILQVAPPPGLALVPALWRAGARPARERLPVVPMSLLVQYKRPEFVTSRQAGQFRYWNRSYYRFEIRQRQHDILRRLERRLRNSALVRYAAPAFWQTWELHAAMATKSVVIGSGYISPGRLGAHKVWSYVEPGIDGVANPSATRLRFDSALQLTGEIIVTSERTPARRAPGDLLDHVIRIAEVVLDEDKRGRVLQQQWAEAIRRRRLRLGDRTAVAVSEMVAAASVLDRLAMNWYVFDSADPRLV